MDKFTYSKQKEISFPLGGIGTGCIGLGGDGRLIDWEIFNRPNKGSINGFSHFAIKAEQQGKVLDARVMNGDLHPPYAGQINMRGQNGYGHGVRNTSMAGVPHFKDVTFRGEYPLAYTEFRDVKFPGTVSMKAFNPLIPLNYIDSSIPAAFFEIEVENTADKTITYTVCFTVSNPLPQDTNVNRYIQDGSIHSIKMTSSSLKEEDLGYGDVSVATDASCISYQENWYRGAWFDGLGIFWRDFISPGRLKNRSYDNPGTDICSLAAHFEVAPGKKESVRFVFSWNFPNCYNYWSKNECSYNCECGTKRPKTWKNYYATVFKDSAASAAYSIQNWKRLYEETLMFKEALFSSSLPEEAIDAVSANISILKTPTCLRLEDGSFYGWEGCNCESGCCEGSCTHVWNYAYALPFLFPKLERSMRNLDFTYNQREDGKMSFRLQLPLGREASSFRACADGQFGGVVKAYRDWKISGDSEWLKSIWEPVKKSIEFAWSPSNEDSWDMDKDGVLEGRQHHTLDMELFGPNSWLTGFYLAALKAGAEMAHYLGEEEKSREYMELYKKGKGWVDRSLFNGEYYCQQIDISDKVVIEKFNAVKDYWNEEAKEIKYQIAEGCAVDQVVAQWHANLCGLGEIFDRGQTYKALQAIYKYNFKKSMRDFFNPCRLYSLNDEAGVVICDWPEGRYKPVVPLTYAEETMNGFEYQAAIHMVQEGLVDQGMEIVKAVRDRYDGERRNPWNEFECGSNYARSMASYALLPAFSGFEFDMVKGLIGFNPVVGDKGFKCFWSLDSGWGVFESEGGVVKLTVLYGQLSLKVFSLPFIKDGSIKTVALGSRNIVAQFLKSDIIFSKPVLIKKGEALTVSSVLDEVAER